jgi:hypothetical protein
MIYPKGIRKQIYDTGGLLDNLVFKKLGKKYHRQRMEQLNE